MLRLPHLSKVKIILDLGLHQFRMRSASITVLQCSAVAFNFWGSACANITATYVPAYFLPDWLQKLVLISGDTILYPKYLLLYDFFPLDHAAFTVNSSSLL